MVFYLPKGRAKRPLLGYKIQNKNGVVRATFCIWVQSIALEYAWDPYHVESVPSIGTLEVRKREIQGRLRAISRVSVGRVLFWELSRGLTSVRNAWC